MNKKTILQRLFSSLLAATLLFGVLHLTTEPAAANGHCFASLFGNVFSHIEEVSLGDGTYLCCCAYITPSGGIAIGQSWYC